MESEFERMALNHVSSLARGGLRGIGCLKNMHADLARRVDDAERASRCARAGGRTRRAPRAAQDAQAHPSARLWTPSSPRRPPSSPRSRPCLKSARRRRRWRARREARGCRRGAFVESRRRTPRRRELVRRNSHQTPTDADEDELANAMEVTGSLLSARRGDARCGDTRPGGTRRARRWTRRR